MPTRCFTVWQVTHGGACGSRAFASSGPGHSSDHAHSEQPTGKKAHPSPGWCILPQAHGSLAGAAPGALSHRLPCPSVLANNQREEVSQLGFVLQAGSG